MIPAVRQQNIMRNLREREGLTVGHLAADLEVSPSTIRRDLALMEEEGILQRTFGGAILTDERDEPIERIHQVNAVGKKAIATTASQLLTDDMTVIIDIGSTALALAEQIRGRRLTIITASLPVFRLFAQEPQTRTLLLGGAYSPDYECTAGHMTVAALREVHADMAFLGCSGIAPDGTIRDNTADQVPVKREILRAADETTLLCDTTKFPGHGSYTVADASHLSRLVTDAPLTVGLRKMLTRSGTEVMYA